MFTPPWLALSVCLSVFLSAPGKAESNLRQIVELSQVPRPRRAACTAAGMISTRLIHTGRLDHGSNYQRKPSDNASDVCRHDIGNVSQQPCRCSAGLTAKRLLVRFPTSGVVSVCISVCMFCLCLQLVRLRFSNFLLQSCTLN